jgi:hypothetical protein
VHVNGTHSDAQESGHTIMQSITQFGLIFVHQLNYLT